MSHGGEDNTRFRRSAIERMTRDELSGCATIGDMFEDCAKDWGGDDFMCANYRGWLSLYCPRHAKKLIPKYCSQAANAKNRT